MKESNIIAAYEFTKANADIEIAMRKKPRNKIGRAPYLSTKKPATICPTAETRKKTEVIVKEEDKSEEKKETDVLKKQTKLKAEDKK